MSQYPSDKKLVKHIDFVIMDFIILEVSYFAANFLKYIVSDSSGVRYFYLRLFHPSSRHQMLILAFALVLTLLFGNPYKDILRRNKFEEFRYTFQHTVNLAVIEVLCMFAMHETIDMSREVTIYLWVIYFIAELGFRYIWKRVLRKRHSSDSRKNSMIVITKSDRLDKLLGNLLMDPLGSFFVSAVFVADYKSFARKIHSLQRSPGGAEALEARHIRFDEDGTITVRNIPVLGSDDEMIEYATHNWVDEAFFDIHDESAMENELLSLFLQMGIRTHRLLTHIITSDSIGTRYVETMSGYTVMSQTPRVIPGYQIFLKRLLDIVGGLIGCAITGVLFLFVAPAIYRKSPGPIFFGQKRVGRNGKIFTMYKFRSMYMDAEERKKELMEQNKIKDGMMFKIDDDPRIIGSEKKDKNGKPKGIGNFIRRTSIDEFPQFFNVLKGDMSLVGTRPPTLDEWEHYSPRYRARMSIRPGITGMWQISGRSNIVDFDEVVKLDTQYIQNWTIGMDIRILIKTVAQVAKHDGAE